MMKTILITGGTGLLGTELVHLLLNKGYNIHLLVRDASESTPPGVKSFPWDVYKKEIDAGCLSGVDAIIHLAGEDIARKRWTNERKQQIIESRTESIRLVYDLMRKTKHKVSTVISASAVGYYGDRGEEVMHENNLPSKDFLAETCIAWEEAVDEGEKLGLRIVKLRSGIILIGKGGLLPLLTIPLKFRLGIVPGNGKQWVSWVHLDDAVGIYTFALENEHVKGAYNMTAPQAVRMEQLIRKIARARHRSALFIHIPKFALEIVTGEMSLMVLESTKANSQKIQSAGYVFRYPVPDQALARIYKSRD